MDTWTSKDKVLHLILGIFITGIVGVHFHNALIGFYVGFIAAIVKEILDKLSYGGMSYKDFIVTIIGSGCSALCLKFFVL